MSVAKPGVSCRKTSLYPLWKRVSDYYIRYVPPGDTSAIFMLTGYGRHSPVYPTVIEPLLFLVA